MVEHLDYSHRVPKSYPRHCWCCNYTYSWHSAFKSFAHWRISCAVCNFARCISWGPTQIFTHELWMYDIIFLCCVVYSPATNQLDIQPQFLLHKATVLRQFRQAENEMW